MEETWLPELQASRLGVHTSLSKGEMKVFGIMDISGAFPLLFENDPHRRAEPSSAGEAWGRFPAGMWQ